MPRPAIPTVHRGVPRGTCGNTEGREDPAILPRRIQRTQEPPRPRVLVSIRQQFVSADISVVGRKIKPPGARSVVAFHTLPQIISALGVSARVTGLSPLRQSFSRMAAPVRAHPFAYRSKARILCKECRPRPRSPFTTRPRRKARASCSGLPPTTGRPPLSLSLHRFAGRRGLFRAQRGGLQCDFHRIQRLPNLYFVLHVGLLTRKLRHRNRFEHDAGVQLSANSLAEAGGSDSEKCRRHSFVCYSRRLSVPRSSLLRDLLHKRRFSEVSPSTR